jgi:hypothetical protein
MILSAQDAKRLSEVDCFEALLHYLLDSLFPHENEGGNKNFFPFSTRQIIITEIQKRNDGVELRSRCTHGQSKTLLTQASILLVPTVSGFPVSEVLLMDLLSSRCGTHE